MRGKLGEGKVAKFKAKARASAGIEPAREAASLETRGHVAHVECLEGEIANLDALIPEVLSKVERLVLAMPGIGSANGAQIATEADDMPKLRDASALASHAGLNSGASQSGRFGATDAHITKRDPAHLKRAMRLAASRAYQCGPALGGPYAGKRAEGESHRETVAAVARELCHIASP